MTLKELEPMRTLHSLVPTMGAKSILQKLPNFGDGMMLAIRVYREILLLECGEGNLRAFTMNTMPDQFSMDYVETLTSERFKALNGREISVNTFVKNLGDFLSMQALPQTIVKTLDEACALLIQNEVDIESTSLKTIAEDLGVA